MPNKEEVNILFIDDNHLSLPIISILKNIGWKNTTSVVDVTDLEDDKVKKADIMFVDINGVGSTFEYEGLGLSSALKKRYPEKKIVIYSAYEPDDIFYKVRSEVDGHLSKNADPYEFTSLIEHLLYT